MQNRLRDYVRRVLDVNKDGRVTIKDLLELFPNYSVAIAFIFVDILVAVAEYRVYDVGYQMTGDPYKAIGFVLVSAIPFYLGQLFWLYPVANAIQKWIAGAMVATALYTSWIFGTADLSKTYDADALVQVVTNMTAGYIIAAIAYILIDDGIKAQRMQKLVEGQAQREKAYLAVTRAVLTELQTTQKLQQTIELEFGDADMVQEQLDRLRKKSPKTQQEARTATQAQSGDKETNERPKA